MENNIIYSLNGVYAIKFFGDRNLYVGVTSCNFGQRFYQHLTLLRRNKHDNKRLQDLFNQFGEDKILMYVLEIGITNKKSLIKAEKKWGKELKKSFSLLNTIIGGRLKFRKQQTIYNGPVLPIKFANLPEFNKWRTETEAART